MKFKAAMFDLDGTLIDSLTDIANAANKSLEEVGRPGYPVNDYRYMVGQGLHQLMVDALGPDHQHLVEKCCELHKKHYGKDTETFTRPYPRIPEMLDGLTARGVTLTILSNKPQFAAEKLIKSQLGRWNFARGYGHRDGHPVKPDPASALEIIRELGIPREEWLYVGDTRVDMLTGVSAGMYTVGVLWGFRDEPELREAGAHAIISDPMQLLELL
jgi:phosphoglycolate phosphatase